MGSNDEAAKMKCETAALQNIKEFNKFISMVLRRNVKSYLEIGSKHGGSLWLMANALPKGSKIVSVDLPNGDGSFKNSQASLEECVKELNRLGYDASLVLGDSIDINTVERVRKLAPFDLCFIDGNHDIKYATKDFENYGQMSRIVAFHDVAWKRGKYYTGLRMGVPDLWKSLKEKYNHSEIILDHKDNGIGVIWR